MKKSRAKTGADLAKTKEKYDTLASEISKLEDKLHKRYRRRAGLELRADQLVGRAYRPPALAVQGVERACLIINPDSGEEDDSGEQLAAILKSLAHCGITADVHLKLSDEYAKRMAREAMIRRLPLVIVAGGDDTVEQVAGELVGSQTALGIVPVGTMNNLARALGIPLSLEGACHMLRAGNLRQIDVGWIRHGAQSAGEYFLEAAGAGLSAIAKKGHAKGDGPGSSLPEAVRDFDDKAGELTIELDEGRTLRSPSGIVTVANAPRMGAHVTVAPEALLDDGMFDVAVYENMSRREVIEYLSRARARPHRRPTLQSYRSARVRITKSAAGDEAPAEAQRRQDLELKIVPGALRVAAGPGAALGNP